MLTSSFYQQKNKSNNLSLSFTWKNSLLPRTKQQTRVLHKERGWCQVLAWEESKKLGHCTLALSLSLYTYTYNLKVNKTIILLWALLDRCWLVVIFQEYNVVTFFFSTAAAYNGQYCEIITRGQYYGYNNASGAHLPYLPPPPVITHTCQADFALRADAVGERYLLSSILWQCHKTTFFLSFALRGKCDKISGVFASHIRLSLTRWMYVCLFIFLSLLCLSPSALSSRSAVARYCIIIIQGKTRK